MVHRHRKKAKTSSAEPTEQSSKEEDDAETIIVDANGEDVEMRTS